MIEFSETKGNIDTKKRQLYATQVFLETSRYDSVIYNQFLESFPSISEWEEKGIGFIFDLPTAFIEYQFQITDNRKYYY